MNVWRPKSPQARIHFVVTGIVLAAVIGLSVDAAGQCPDCPSPEPIPEIARGWNLYWHNPCQCMNENCYPSTCSTALSPTWYAMAEIMPLYRDESGDVVYQSDGTTGDSVLTAGDFDSDFNAGGRFLMGVSLGDYYRLEASYLGSYEWDDSIAVRNTDDITQPGQGGIGNLYSPYSDFGDPVGIPGVDFNQVAAINYSSQMENFEINLRRRVQLLSDLNFHRNSLFNQGEPLLFDNRAETSFLVGIRYMKIDEKFGYLTGSSVPGGSGSTNSVNVSADNAMIGAQLGLLSQFLILPRTWIDFEIKGVIFQNHIDVRSNYSNTDNAGTPIAGFRGRDKVDRTSFLGELSLMYNHQVTRALTFRAGYTAMWVTEVALATQNFSDDINITATGPVQAYHNGDVVYHGPSMGLVFAF